VSSSATSRRTSASSRNKRARSRPLAAAAPVFAALGDGTRLGLVRRLADEGPLSITQLTADTGVTRQAVTRHLDVLHDAGLVRGTKIGREHVWQLEAARLELASRSLDQISGWWADKLNALKAKLESETRK